MSVAMDMLYIHAIHILCIFWNKALALCAVCAPIMSDSFVMKCLVRPSGSLGQGCLSGWITCQTIKAMQSQFCMFAGELLKGWKVFPLELTNIASLDFTAGSKGNLALKNTVPARAIGPIIYRWTLFTHTGELLGQCCIPRSGRWRCLGWDF